jgi:hypothetical protein
MSLSLLCLSLSPPLAFADRQSRHTTESHDWLLVRLLLLLRLGAPSYATVGGGLANNAVGECVLLMASKAVVAGWLAAVDVKTICMGACYPLVRMHTKPRQEATRP